ncbi:MAG TPA: glucose-1-phosphate cytidylyltransferase [Acidimicrobiales bacterium]|jgi:glucose-1-phosphate cytidylyltransferase|nr:glucose-1-phosphate cytidylyltransferase [Acidimicrobiales bacterium]
MKVVILAGGLGTRLADDAQSPPKPMVQIGTHPILWHIMQHYGVYGHNEFLICLGYRGDIVKRYFAEQAQVGTDITVSTATGEITRHAGPRTDWVVHLVDTGLSTNTGGRVKRLKQWLDDDDFLLTYGDGVATVDLERLLAFHRSHDRIATVTAVRPPARYGGLLLNGDFVSHFSEKRISEGWINGGFMVLSREILDHIPGDDTNLELDVLEGLAEQEQLAAYRHEGFWQCMDTPRDVRTLLDLWNGGAPPWKTW